MRKMTNINNPWSEIITTSSYCCCKDDELYIKMLVSIPKYRQSLKLTSLPDPYNGNPDAPVYILNGNPGFNDLDTLFAKDKNFQIITQRNMIHDFEEITYCSDIKDTNEHLHPGCKWWQGKLKNIPRKQNIFNVEFFPYHSKSFVHDLLFPSFEYTRSLVLKAIDEGKSFIIRGSFLLPWYSAVPQLIDYSGEKYITNYPRSIYFLESKIKEYPKMHKSLF